MTSTYPSRMHSTSVYPSTALPPLLVDHAHRTTAAVAIAGGVSAVLLLVALGMC